jgi:hypothetical protein
MGDAADPIQEREQSLRLQIAGQSAGASSEEAKRGIEAARVDVAEGRGSGYGVGFGFIKNFGAIDGQDGQTLGFAITDGTREANVHARISETQLGSVTAEEEDVASWISDRLYAIAGGIARDEDRYLTILRMHPLNLG